MQVTEIEDRPTMIIVKTGQAVPEARADGRDFEHWFAEGLGSTAFDYRVVRVDHDEVLPPPGTLASNVSVLVTGSPAMVSAREAWSERAAEWLARVHELGQPILGVCYGHQLVARALGGTVGPNPAGRRMGRVDVEIVDRDDALLGPFAPRRAYHVSHLEAVLEAPVAARVIATAPHDPNHALYFGRRTWGVQFHPEFDSRIMRAYLEARADLLASEGQDPAALIDGLQPGDDGPAVLARFGRLARMAAGDAAA